MAERHREGQDIKAMTDGPDVGRTDKDTCKLTGEAVSSI